MGQHTIGELLRELRTRHGRSQAEQAEVLSELAERAVTRHEVSRWEREARLLTPFWQRHYASSFGVPVEQLRLAVAAARAQRQQQEVDPVQRRQFLSVMAGMALPAGTDGGCRLGPSDVDRLGRHTARLRRLDDILGGGDTYGIYAAEAERTAALINRSEHSQVVARALRSLLAEQHQLAGWAAFDAGRHSQARTHYRDSRAAAVEADDGALAANALAFMAYQQTTVQDDGTRAADAAVAQARRVATPRVGALLLERSAWAHAVAGDSRAADTALGQSREELNRSDNRPEPDWTFWVDGTELDIMTGRCWTELRRPLRAVPVLERVLATFDDTHGRDKALYLTWLASSYLQAREVEQAATTLGRAHELSAGVASVRPLARFADVARQLEPHRCVPEVADVLDQIAVIP